MRVFAGLLLVTFIAGCETVTPPPGPSSTPASRPTVSSEPSGAPSPAATIASTTSPTPLPSPRPTPIPGTWNHPVVAIKDAGRPVFFAVDAAGHAHVAYGRGDKTAYATDASGTWVEDQRQFPGAENISPVGTDLPQFAIDEGGALHAAYTSGRMPSRDLYYATNAGGSWAERRLTRNAALDFFPAIAVDPTGHVHVLAGRTTLSRGTFEGRTSYSWSAADAVYHLTTASGRWAVSRVPMPRGHLFRSPSMATDARGRLHVVLVWSPLLASPRRWDLIYLTNASGTWKTTVINKGRVNAAGYSDLYEPSNVIVDSDGRVHVAFTKNLQCSSSNRMVIYATNASGRWVKNTVVVKKPASQCDSVFSNPTLAVDATGTGHITYEQSGSEGVREFHATNESGSWTAEKLGPDGLWYSARMAADGTGRLRLVFRQGGRGCPPPSECLWYRTRN